MLHYISCLFCVADDNISCISSHEDIMIIIFLFVKFNPVLLSTWARVGGNFLPAIDTFVLNTFFCYKMMWTSCMKKLPMAFRVERVYFFLDIYIVITGAVNLIMDHPSKAFNSNVSMQVGKYYTLLPMCKVGRIK